MGVEASAGHIVQNNITWTLCPLISGGLEDSVCKRRRDGQSANDLEISTFVHNNGCHAAAKSGGRSLS
jgi:hypothetical protein